MEDPVTEGNLSNEGVSDNNDTGTSLTEIMGSMTSSKEPEAKPEAANDEGKKAEGTEKSQADLPAWTNQLPEEMRKNSDTMKQLMKFGKIGDLAKSYSELESKLGKAIELPGKEAKPEEVEAFYQKLGKPETADKYTIDDKNADTFKELAYKYNLTDEQAKGIYAGAKALTESYMQQAQDKLIQTAKATESALKSEYGTDAQVKLDLCKRGVLAFGGPELGQKLQASGLLYDIDVVKMFIKLGEMNAEAGTSTKAAPSGGYKTTNEGGSFNFKGIN